MTRLGRPTGPKPGFTRAEVVAAALALGVADFTLAGVGARLGVATSALEMEQNAGRTRWDFATADAKLTAIMADIHDSCVAAAEEYGRPGDYVLGANAAGFTRVADVMIAHGIV